MAQQQQKLVDALLDIPAIQETLRLQLEETETQLHAASLEWNRQIATVVDQTVALLDEQLDLVKVWVDASNQEFMAATSDQFVEYQEAVQAKLSEVDATAIIADLSNKVEALIKKADSKIPTASEAQEIKEFLLTKANRLQQELIAQAFALEAISDEVLESARAEVVDLQQTFAAVNVDLSVVKERILNAIPPLSLDSLASNVMLSDLSASFDFEHLQGQFESVLQALAQVELPAFPSIDVSANAVRVPHFDFSGMKDAIMVPRVDFAVMKDAVKVPNMPVMPNVDFSGMKESAQEMVDRAFDKISSFDTEGVKASAESIKESIRQQLKQAQESMRIPSSPLVDELK